MKELIRNTLKEADEYMHLAEFANSVLMRANAVFPELVQNLQKLINIVPPEITDK